MWEEDPRYQESNYRLLIGGVLIAMLFGLVCAILFDAWTNYLLAFKAIGLSVLSITVYNFILCTAVATIRFIFGRISAPRSLWRGD